MAYLRNTEGFNKKRKWDGLRGYANYTNNLEMVRGVG